MFLRRDEISTLAKQLTTSGAEPKRRRFMPNLPNIPGVTGDKNQEEAAKLIVERQAASLSARGSETVVVVIGSDADRTKVKESLAGVQRNVVLMYVNHDFSNEQFDNTPIKGGMAGQITNTATNLWVFLPKTGAAADRKPDRTLSTKVATSQMWTGIFGAAGDVGQVTSALTAMRQKPAQDAEATGTTGDAANAATGTFAEGDVVTPKIANVRLMAQPADDAKAVATLTKGEELVITGGEKNGYVNVQGATGAGWIKVVLVSKK